MVVRSMKRDVPRVGHPGVWNSVTRSARWTVFLHDTHWAT